ncbi:hypothetical protein CTI12_AA399730 [Artemisia annua]|uniref:Uncharacterized protein n=1 Tax=Artemisia annua TaxID=35608 RepID=A0A2U1MAL2_ARTAN|nr:hypothetical protein CTI12_AA399730 [Artemisia annua]
MVRVSDGGGACRRLWLRRMMVVLWRFRYGWPFGSLVTVVVDDGFEEGFDDSGSMVLFTMICEPPTYPAKLNLLFQVLNLGV